MVLGGKDDGALPAVPLPCLLLLRRLGPSLDAAAALTASAGAAGSAGTAAVLASAR